MALKGCCCCGLRGGALAVGVVFLVLTVLELLPNIVSWGIVASNRPAEVGSFSVDTPDGGFDARVRQGESGGEISLELGEYSGSVSSSGDMLLSTPLVDRRTHQSLVSEVHYSSGDRLHGEVLLAVETVYLLLALLFNSLLIHGTNKSSSCSVLAWLVYYGIVFVVATLASLGLLIACFVFLSASNNGSDWRFGDVDAGTLAIIFGVAGGICVPLSMLFWYSWAVVLAFHQQLSAATSGFKYSRDVLP